MATAPLLPAIESIPTLSVEKRAEILDLLFEPCDELHSLSIDMLRNKRHSYAKLIQDVGAQLAELARSNSSDDMEKLDKILGAHPRLGEKKVDSKQSQAEQAHIKAASEEESKRLAALNAEYEQTFPGLRYVVFVNGRSRPTIMDDMRERITRRDISLERGEAIKAMCEIALDRASKLGRS